MRIAVYGAGGVGGYFGGRLAQAGEEVVFIARGEHLRAMRERGLRVDSINGDFFVDPVQASDDPVAVGPVDVVILGVKTWQVPGAAKTMRPMVGPGTFVLPLQNGVEAPARLAELLGPEHVIGGLCRIISFLAGPGHIQHVGADPFVHLGELDNSASQRVARLREAFERAGVTAVIPPDIQVAIWRKFIFIVAMSGMGAITRAPMGVFRDLPQTRHMMRGVMREAFDVGRAHGVALPEALLDELLAFIDSAPPEGTASMQRDIMAGRPSELEAQNGAVVRLGQKAGVDTPLNAFITHSLLPLELKARGELQFPT